MAQVRMEPRMHVGGIAVLSVLSAVIAGAVFAAEPMDEKAARKQLFAPRGVSAEIVPGALNGAHEALMRVILKGMRKEGVTDYYGAVAVSPVFFDMVQRQPAKAALSGLFKVTTQMHSPEQAESVALESCATAARAAGAPPCVIAVQILPKRWKPRDFTLSGAATEDFKIYRREKEPKAFAISTSSNAYAIGVGDGAQNDALTACRAKLSATSRDDCAVVIVD